MPNNPKHASSEKTRMEMDRDTLLERNLPTLSGSMTFAKMVRVNQKFFPNLKDLDWLFPHLCQRKDQATLTDTEKERYICAFNLINNDGTLGQLVKTHSEMHMQHTNPRLLPWHRVFLYLFEEALHNYHPDVCVPYWVWTKPQEQHFPDWLVGVLPTVHTPTRTINVVRSPGAQSWLASLASGTRLPWRRRTTVISPVLSMASTAAYTFG